MSNIEEKHDKKTIINSKKKIHKENDTDKKILFSDNTKNDLQDYSSNISENNKKFILDTPVNITVELGKSKIKIKDFLNLSKGSMLVLDRLKDEPLDIFVNGHLIALGEIVFLENKYGLRITSIKHAVKSTNTLA